jgi:signal transduction histidine kinase
VEDTGPGIPPEVVDEIFLPYVRGPNQGKGGLGLGLATVKRLCETRGGRVGVRSVLGRGSIFWIELPLASTPIGPAAVKVIQSPL